MHKPPCSIPHERHCLLRRRIRAVCAPPATAGIHPQYCAVRPKRRTHAQTHVRTQSQAYTHACSERAVLPGYDAYHISIDDRCTFAKRNRRDRACGGKECAAVLPARSKAMTRVGAATPGVGPDARLRVSRVLRTLQAAHLSAVAGRPNNTPCHCLRNTCSVRPDAGQVCLERFRASRHLAAQGAHHFLRAFEQESAPDGRTAKPIGRQRYANPHIA